MPPWSFGSASSWTATNTLTRPSLAMSVRDSQVGAHRRPRPVAAAEVGRCASSACARRAGQHRPAAARRCRGRRPSRTGPCAPGRRPVASARRRAGGIGPPRRCPCRRCRDRSRRRAARRRPSPRRRGRARPRARRRAGCGWGGCGLEVKEDGHRPERGGPHPGPRDGPSATVAARALPGEGDERQGRPPWKHPISGPSVTDDLTRKIRLTVVLRTTSQIPHLIWLTLWGIVVLLALIVRRLRDALRRETPEGLHNSTAQTVLHDPRRRVPALPRRPLPGLPATRPTTPTSTSCRRCRRTAGSRDPRDPRDPGAHRRDGPGTWSRSW